MALDKPGLTSDLQAILESMPPTASDAAEAMANAYGTYAQTGQAGAGLPVVTPAHKSALKATLLAAISNPLIGLPATFAGAWGNGVDTFWTGMPIAGAVSGSTAGCPGKGALIGSLSGVFANPLNTAAICAAGMANALDTATKTVIATVAPPPGTTVNIA